MVQLVMVDLLIAIGVREMMQFSSGNGGSVVYIGSGFGYSCSGR